VNKGVCFIHKKMVTSFVVTITSIFFSLLVSGIFLGNGIGHILQFIFFRSYVPGIISTILILLPFYFISIKYLYEEQLITISKLLNFLLLGGILQTPFALVSILVAKAVF
jgi:hypothetical protein